MSTIEIDQISLYCYFNKIIKRSETSFQSPALKQKHVRNVCHTAHKYLTKFHSDSTKWLSVRLCTKWLWVRVLLQSLKQERALVKLGKMYFISLQKLFLLQRKSNFKILDYQISWSYQMSKHKTRNSFYWTTWEVNTIC